LVPVVDPGDVVGGECSHGVTVVRRRLEPGGRS
jgi:hypothetical protein